MEPGGSMVVVLIALELPVVVPAAVARRPRATVGKVLFLLGCAAATLALFGMALNGSYAAATAAAAADLRTKAAEELLLLLVAAAGQALTSTAAVLVMAPPFSLVACASAGFTGGLHVASSIYVLAACNDSLRGELLGCYVLFVIALFAALVVGIFVSFEEDDRFAAVALCAHEYQIPRNNRLMI